MKLVHYLRWQTEFVESLARQFPDVDFVQGESKEHAAEELSDASILVVGGPFYQGPIADAVNANAPELRWIQSLSIGTDLFEKAGVPEHITFTNAAGLKGRTVGEHAIALLLAYIHAIPQMERSRVEGVWCRDDLRTEIDCLEGKTILLLGYGSIGQEIARKAKAFDMHVVALNRSGDDSGQADTVAPITELRDRLPAADYIVSSLPLTSGTEKLMGDTEFALMKATSVFVNVGRGAVVDQRALVHALQENRIAGACLDVYEEEPLPSDDPLWGMKNVILSPHVGGTGGAIGERFTELVGENIALFQKGLPLKNQVNLTRD